HGAKVLPGDLLVAFDTQRIDQTIHQLETDKKFLDANVKLSEEELLILEKGTPHELAVAERAHKESDEDLKYFLKVGRPESEKSVDRMVKTAKFYLDSAKEELRQLEKMYKANDLTEETEEIILKRQRFWVERAADWFKSAEIERDYVLKV